NPRVMIAFRNFGKGPAYDVRYRGIIGFAEYPMPENFKLPHFRGRYSQPFTVMPEIEYFQPINAKEILTEAHFREIQERKGRFIVQGEAHYRLRLWMTRRYLRFAYFVFVASDGQIVNEMTPVGNDSN